MAQRKKAAAKRGKREPAKRKTRPSDGGRPMLDESEFERFFEYLEAGLSLTLACDYTGISHHTVKRHRERFPEFDRKVRAARGRPILACAQSLLKMATRDEDPDASAAKFILERRCPDFRLDVESANNTEEVLKALMQLGAIAARKGKESDDGYE